MNEKETPDVLLALGEVLHALNRLDESTASSVIGKQVTDMRHLIIDMMRSALFGRPKDDPPDGSDV